MNHEWDLRQKEREIAQQREELADGELRWRERLCNDMQNCLTDVADMREKVKELTETVKSFRGALNALDKSRGFETYYQLKTNEQDRK